MPFHSTALLNDKEARDALGLKNQTNDEDLARLVNSLTFTFEKVTGRLLKQRTLTNHRVDGSGDYSILLPFVPVQSITQIQIRYRDETIYATITDSTKWKLIGRTGELELLEDIFIEGNKNVLITMSVGYLAGVAGAAGDLELDTAKDLLIMQLKHTWHQTQSSETGLVSRSMSDGSMSFFPPNRLLREVVDGLGALFDFRP